MERDYDAHNPFKAREFYPLGFRLAPPFRAGKWRELAIALTWRSTSGAI